MTISINCHNQSISINRFGYYKQPQVKEPKISFKTECGCLES